VTKIISVAQSKALEQKLSIGPRYSMYYFGAKEKLRTSFTAGDGEKGKNSSFRRRARQPKGKRIQPGTNAR
jgi:hypothetical protein